MSVTIRRALKGQLNEFRPDSTVREISARALDHFQQRLDEIAKAVAAEAMKSNYDRLSPMDIERGFQKWHESKIAGKLRIAIDG